MQSRREERVTGAGAEWRWGLAAVILFALWLDWPGIKTWFSADDFAWLGLRLHVHDFGTLVWALFHPFAQGTVRVLSERIYFLTLSSLFGLDAIPFHAVTFLTQAAALVLLAVCVRRMTGSIPAALAAPVLWTCSSMTAQAVAWSSAYNEVLCGALLLGAFYFLLRHIESNRGRDLAGLWICYVLGFGTLEHIVVFPFLAAAWALCRARGYVLRTLPLFIPAAAFAVLHFALVPATTDRLYQLHVDASMFRTFRIYWLMATGAFRAPDDWFAAPHPAGLILSMSISISLIGLAAFQASKRDFRGLFFLGWFVLTVGPVLPLRDHIQDYYLTLPVIGLAMLGAWGIGLALENRRAPYVAAAGVLAGTFCLYSARDLRVELNWYYARGRRLESLIDGIAEERKIHPGEIILLNGVSDRLFWSGFGDHPFRLLGLGQIYLAPGTESAINPHPEWGGISEYLIPPAQARAALAAGKAQVLTIVSGRLLETTAAYRNVLDAEMGNLSHSIVDAADPASASRFGPGWYPPEQDFRWMPRTATVRLDAPRNPGMDLVVTGYCPAVLVAQGPLRLTVSANGIRLGIVKINAPEQAIVLKFPLPPQLAGANSMKLGLSLDRVYRAPGDKRDLGLIIRRFELLAHS
jgi:hypothetical protein